MSAPAHERPQHPLRRAILLLLFLAMTVNILDRQVLSLVAPVLRDQFRLSNTQYGVSRKGTSVRVTVPSGAPASSALQRSSGQPRSEWKRRPGPGP